MGRVGGWLIGGWVRLGVGEWNWVIGGWVGLVSGVR